MWEIPRQTGGTYGGQYTPASMAGTVAVRSTWRGN